MRVKRGFRLTCVIDNGPLIPMLQDLVRRVGSGRSRCGFPSLATVGTLGSILCHVPTTVLTSPMGTRSGLSGHFQEQPHQFVPCAWRQFHEGISVLRIDDGTLSTVGAGNMIVRTDSDFGGFRGRIHRRIGIRRLLAHLPDGFLGIVSS